MRAASSEAIPGPTAKAAKREARALSGASTAAHPNQRSDKTANLFLSKDSKRSEVQAFSPAPGQLSGELGAVTMLRAGVPADHPFVIDSWLLSGRSQAIARDAGRGYAGDMKWLLRRLLERGALLVACDKEEPGAIWGWALTRGSSIFYVYVRQEFRRKGLARALLAPFLDHQGEVVYCARLPFRSELPQVWRYSFLHAVRVAAE